MSSLSRMSNKLRWVLPVAAVAVIVGACELDVSDPQAIREEEASGPAAVPLTINGVINDVANMSEHYALYSGMFTDEFILAGTFPTRAEVDNRAINASNATIAGEVDESLQTARRQAFKMDSSFQTFVGDDAFNQADVLDGIAIGKYVNALATLQLGELFCTPVIDAGAEPTSSQAAVERALTLFQEAETAAADAGLGSWEQAAMVGQGRAHIFLGSLTGDATHFDDAAAAVADVDTEHRLLSEFSTNSPAQFNKVYDLTWGSQNEVIRWTVGDGAQSERDNEKFAEFDEFVGLGIIDPDFCSSCAFNSNIAVQQQMLYDEPADDIAISKGAHARLIEAEAAIRNGNTGTAEDLINTLRDSWDDRWSANRFAGVNEPSDVTLTGDTEDDLATLMGEYARETWITGTRQENLRRLVEEFGAGSALDLFPERTGDQICYPVTEQEETGGQP